MTIPDAVAAQILKSGIDKETGLPALPEGYAWRVQNPDMFDYSYRLQLWHGARVIRETVISSETAQFRYLSNMTDVAKELLLSSTESYVQSLAQQRTESVARIKTVRKQSGPLFTRHQLVITDEQLGEFLSAFRQDSPLEIPTLPEGLRFVAGKVFRLRGDGYRANDMELGKAKLSLARVRQVPLFGGLLWMTVGYDILSTTLFSRGEAGRAMDFRSVLINLFSYVNVEQPGAGRTKSEILESQRQAAVRQFT